MNLKKLSKTAQGLSKPIEARIQEVELEGIEDKGSSILISAIRNSSLCPVPWAENIDNSGHKPIFLIMSVHFCQVLRA